MPSWLGGSRTAQLPHPASAVLLHNPSSKFTGCALTEEISGPIADLFEPLAFVLRVESILLSGLWPFPGEPNIYNLPAELQRTTPQAGVLCSSLIIIL